jgi:hypothetical protein
MGTGTAAFLLGPPAYRDLMTLVQRSGAAQVQPIARVAATQTTAIAPIHSSGGFLAIQDTAIVPLQWDPGLTALPAITTQRVAASDAEIVDASTDPVDQ